MSWSLSVFQTLVQVFSAPVVVTGKRQIIFLSVSRAVAFFSKNSAKTWDAP